MLFQPLGASAPTGSQSLDRRASGLHFGLRRGSRSAAPPCRLLPAPISTVLEQEPSHRPKAMEVARQSPLVSLWESRLQLRRLRRPPRRGGVQGHLRKSRHGPRQSWVQSRGVRPSCIGSRRSLTRRQAQTRLTWSSSTAAALVRCPHHIPPLVEVPLGPSCSDLFKYLSNFARRSFLSF